MTKTTSLTTPLKCMRKQLFSYKKGPRKKRVCKAVQDRIKTSAFGALVKKIDFSLYESEREFPESCSCLNRSTITTDMLRFI